MNKAIKINPQDNLIVALENLKKGEVIELDQQQITLSEDIQQKHKFADRAIHKGEVLTMYGVKVGIANQEISKGAALTTKNMDNAFNDDISFKKTGKFWKVSIRSFIISPLPAPSSIKLNFLGHPKFSQKLIVQIASISENNIDIFGAVIKSPFSPNGT